ncbi:hypothetical protein SAMN05421820_101261 [Pedobacter steynii]|uniref:Lipoprotein n=1 Tax=Pedobacter steynii TaxID=430522 RepID=A0A1G9JGW5_9SPHI|nr:hypothetical protein [Pedobacter steynii]NQX38248.1 hypothetical protein [Pedobacter steynii]SDL36820.1 hypothetical protein SAMN05421820_101261 [Pedobacter steynii]
MKNLSLITLSVGSMLFFSCQQTPKNNTAAETKDSLSSTTEQKKTERTDTVPATAPTTVKAYNENTVKLVKDKLVTIFKDDLSKNLIPEPSRKFILFEYDLNEDGKTEIFVGLTGPYFCGSGGCTFLLLNHEGEKVTQFTVTDYPVIIAKTKTKGWKDLILSSAGKNHLMKFNGTGYPSNPSVQPIFEGTPGNDLPKFPNTVNADFPWVNF